MTYGESLGADGRGLFKMAALTFFVEMQKLNRFDFACINMNVNMAIERADMFVNLISEALSAEVIDEAQKEGGSNE